MDIKKIGAVLTTATMAFGSALPVFALDVQATTDASGTAKVDTSGTQVNVGVGANASTSVKDDDQSENVGDDRGIDADMDDDGSLELKINRTNASGHASINSALQVQSNNDLEDFVATQVNSDENVSTVELGEDVVIVVYKQHAKLFGFIPVLVNATAEVNADGTVAVSYPWYAIFASANKADLEAKVKSAADATLRASGNASAQGQAASNAGKNGVVSGNASATGTAEANANAQATANTAVQLTARTQATLVAALRAAMKAQFEADASASASASAE